MTTEPNLPSSRSEAKALGLRHYMTGKPCPRGHSAPRFVSTGACTICCRENTMAAYEHKTARRRAYNTLETFVAAATAAHAGKYTYETAVYVDAHTPLAIACRTHGVFLQSPTNHIQGRGCPTCKNEKTGLRSRKTTADFVAAAERVWGVGHYDYSKVDYSGAHNPVTIICRDHGEFTTTPTNHLSGAQSCSKCNHMASAGEAAVLALCSAFAETQSRVNPFAGDKRELDVYVPSHSFAVEYCGDFHHACKTDEQEQKYKNRHYQKYVDCKTLGVRLITLYESEWLNHNYAVRRLLRNALGKGKGKLMARKCELKKVDAATAAAFYDRYHPQGGAGNGEHYGLFWRGKLVACMRFTFGANDRGAAAAARMWTLTRFATRVTVAGGASRLFKAFVAEHNPAQVKSFSDNRFFEGGMYAQLGFALDAERGADYQVWSPKLGLRPKSHYQRRNIPARLREHGIEDTFDPETDPRTEADMTYLMRCGRLYDCGKKRWLWTAPAQA